MNTNSSMNGFLKATYCCFILIGFTSFANGLDYSLTHRIDIDGQNSGSVSTNFSSTKRLSISRKINIKVSQFLIFNYSFNASESMVFNNEKMEKYNSSGTEDGKPFKVSASLSGNTLHVYSSNNGRENKSMILKSSYDITSEMAPVYFMKKKIKKSSFRVLDLDLYSVVQTTYVNLGNESLNVLGNNIDTQVISYESSEGRGKQWWYLKNSEYFLIKEKGKSRSNEIELNITNLKGISF